MRFEPPRAKSDDERILPLTNVVFLLLIFFMLAGRLAASDPFNIEPPRSASDGRVGERDLMVLIGADKRLAFNGEVMKQGALKGAVAERISRNTAARIRLKADGRVETTRVVAIMELLREAGANKLELLTVPESG